MLTRTRAAYDWISDRSTAQAGRWYRGLLKAIDSLAVLPFRCPIAAESDEFSVEIRELLYGRRPNIYRIIFEVRDDIILILSVHHASRGELRR